MIEIIPAIDIIDGKCVRLTQGNYTKKSVYSDDPVDVAVSFENAGIKRLHLVDLDGARQKKIVNIGILKKIAAQTNLIIDFGGGIQSDSDIQKAFDAGAFQVTCGSIAVKNPEKVSQWIQHYGAEKIILGADIKEKNIAVSGWEEKTTLVWQELILNYYQLGIRTAICTDIGHDGMLSGPNQRLYQDILRIFPLLHLIASGGVSCVNDIKSLQKNGVSGVIIGKALYEQKITLSQLQEFLC